MQPTDDDYHLDYISEYDHDDLTFVASDYYDVTWGEPYTAAIDRLPDPRINRFRY